MYEKWPEDLYPQGKNDKFITTLDLISTAKGQNSYSFHVQKKCMINFSHTWIFSTYHNYYLVLENCWQPHCGGLVEGQEPPTCHRWTGHPPGSTSGWALGRSKPLPRCYSHPRTLHGGDHLGVLDVGQLDCEITPLGGDGTGFDIGTEVPLGGRVESLEGYDPWQWISLLLESSPIPSVLHTNSHVDPKLFLNKKKMKKIKIYDHIQLFFVK